MYKENSFFFHLLRNWNFMVEKPQCEYIGLAQGDMILNEETMEGLSRGTALNPNKIIVYRHDTVRGRATWNMSWMHTVINDFF